MAFRPFGMRGERGSLGEQVGVAPLYVEQVKPVVNAMLTQVVEAPEVAPVVEPVEVAPQEQIAA